MSMRIETESLIPAVVEAQPEPVAAPNWLYNLRVLWEQRRLLARTTTIAFVVSLTIACTIPKTYVSQARLMPPETSGSSASLLAALAGRAFGSDALGGLAATLMGGHNSGALFIELLHSDSVTAPLIERFQLQHVYHKRYRVDAAKALARRTTVIQDKKSGVLTLSVKDTNPQRARELAQAYLDQLNLLVNRTGTSSARQERIFIEKRLQEVKGDLDHAQSAMSDFSSTHAAIDLKEQARATVESQARVQGELIAVQSELESLRQIYGDANIRVRTAQARIASLKRELSKMGGSSAPTDLASDALTVHDTPPAQQSSSYLPLRQVPRLAVPYANLYRQVRVQEAVYDLLTQQYELARIQEAKDIPAINIIDAPAIPEKKSFPPRTLLTLLMTAIVLIVASFVLLARHHWELIDKNDPRRIFASEVFESLASAWHSLRKRRIALP